MLLIDMPVQVGCRISFMGSSDGRSHEPYQAVGVTQGRYARVLARYPVHEPRYVELQLDGERVVTLPYDIATAVHVQPLPDGLER